MRYLRLTATCIAAVLLPLIALACSSSDSDADAAAKADQDAGVATEGYELKQTFDLNMELTSSVFNRIRRIPIEYTCTANVAYGQRGVGTRYGEDKSPPLAWSTAPEGTMSFAVLVDDPDAFTADVDNPDDVRLDKGIEASKVHWLIWNIPADVTELPERMATTTEVALIGPDTRQGTNDFEEIGWSGPCPPSNVESIDRRGPTKVQKPRGYLLRVYALDTVLDLAGGATKGDLLAAMEGHILDGGELTGEYVNQLTVK